MEGEEEAEAEGGEWEEEKWEETTMMAMATETKWR